MKVNVRENRFTLNRRRLDAISDAIPLIVKKMIENGKFVDANLLIVKEMIENGKFVDATRLIVNEISEIPKIVDATHNPQ